MCIELQVLKESNKLINFELSVLTNELKTPAELNTNSQKQAEELKTQLSTASEHKKQTTKSYEKDKKRYKLLQKYGDVLNQIEKLLEIHAVSTEDLSMEELAQKLEYLAKTRKFNYSQISFTTYQNLFSDITSKLLEVESKFQNGEIKEADASAEIKALKFKLNQNTHNIPTELTYSKESLSDLIDSYESCYNNPKGLATNKDGINEPLINPESKLIFENLNNRTQELNFEVSELKIQVANFEPQVDLSTLTEKLKSTDTIFDATNFDVDGASYAVNDLSNLTNNLYNEQLDKNKDHEKLSNEIKSATAKTTDMTTVSIKQMSEITFKQAQKRADKVIDEVENLQELSEGENSLPQSVGEKHTEAILDQLADDAEYCNKLSAQPDVENVFNNVERTEEAQEKVEQVQEHFSNLTKEEQALLQLKLEQEKEEA